MTQDPSISHTRIAVIIDDPDATQILHSDVFNSLDDGSITIDACSGDTALAEAAGADLYVLVCKRDRAALRAWLRELADAGITGCLLLIDGNMMDLVQPELGTTVGNFLFREHLTAEQLRSAALHGLGRDSASSVRRETSGLSAVIEWDVSRDRMYLSHALRSIVGQQDSGALSQQGFFNTVSPSSKEKVIAFFSEAGLEPVQGERTLTFSLLGSDGSDYAFGGIVETTETYEDGAPLRLVISLFTSGNPFSPGPAPFEEVLEMLRMPAMLITGEGTFLHANRALQEHYGWETRGWTGCYTGDIEALGEVFRDNVLPLLLAGEPWEGDLSRKSVNGHTHPVRASWRVLKLSSEEAYIVGIEEDLTEKRNVEQELMQARKLAKIGILSEGIAHELRNPLSYALSAAQLLEMDTIDTETRDKCRQTVTTGLQKAGMIVENLLSLGKPKSQFVRKSVDIVEVINDALASASVHRSYKEVTVSRHYPEHDLLVMGNHDMLVQVFHNVITNALNEMPDGGELTVEGSQASSMVRVRLTDTGPGVSEEQLKHLFDPFYTASSSGNGTGLGLTLSYYIMKEHEGSIEVESSSGKGATFIISIPRFVKDLS